MTLIRKIWRYECWEIKLQMQSTASIGTPNERSPLGYYDDDAFCAQSISGSNWVLANIFTGQYETDSTMTITCPWREIRRDLCCNYRGICYKSLLQLL